MIALAFSPKYPLKEIRRQCSFFASHVPGLSKSVTRESPSGTIAFHVAIFQETSTTRLHLLCFVFCSASSSRSSATQHQHHSHIMGSTQSTPAKDTGAKVDAAISKASAKTEKVRTDVHAGTQHRSPRHTAAVVSLLRSGSLCGDPASP